MLSKTITQSNRIYAICQSSGDIRPGADFHGVSVAKSGSTDALPANAQIVCCGKVSDSELLFRTEDGRYYFSIRDGWGEENGRLYGLRHGIFYDFQHPTAAETILAECAANIGTYHSWGGAMAYQGRKRTLDVIRSVMKNGGTAA